MASTTDIQIVPLDFDTIRADLKRFLQSQSDFKDYNFEGSALSLLIDLLDPRWKLAGEQMPEKIEGLCLGPQLPDGRQTLLLSSDNDFESKNASLIWVFALPALKTAK